MIRIIARLILFVGLLGALMLQLDEERASAEPQLAYGCNTFSTSRDQCASGCTEVDVQQFSDGEGAKRLDSVYVECNAPSGNYPGCYQYLSRAVDNPACCDRDGDGARGTHPGCGTGSDCDDSDPSRYPRNTENCSDGKDNNCNGQTDCADWACLGDAACCHGAGGTFIIDDQCCGHLTCGETGHCEGCDPACDPGDVCYEGVCLPGSPILVDVLGNGFSLTNAANGVTFDLNGDGTSGQISWTAHDSDDAWLALDRNGNGTIDNGQELFGNFTQQPPASHKNGFLALREFDLTANGGNGNGMIDSGDAVFDWLRLWQDANHNGISESGELHRLRDLGLKNIDLDFKQSKNTDQFGNHFSYRAKVKDTHNAQLGRWAWDVFLLKQ